MALTSLGGTTNVTHKVTFLLPQRLAAPISRFHSRISSSPRKKQPTMLAGYHIVPAARLKQEQLAESATLFSEHYGSWSAQADIKIAGKRVKYSPARFKSALLFDETCYIVRATDDDGELLGHATFVLFPYEDGRGVWISQLVVKSSARDRGIASGLLMAAVSQSNEGDVVAAGIASSHPHAIRAFKRATFCLHLDPDFTASHCASLLSASNIPYLRPPNNTVFGFWHAEQDADSASLIRSNFYVDHSEPEKALQDERDWDLGALEEGSEFVVAAPINASKRKLRSASAGSAGSGGKSEEKAEGK